MKDWSQFAKACNDTAKATGSKPNPLDYFIVKFTDNLIPFSIFILTIVFAYVGLFMIDPAENQKVNWALHAAELSLGVFLGLLKGSHKD